MMWVARPFPPPVSIRFTEGPLRDYWLARVEQHTDDSYAGVRLSKFPEDLRTYEHLMWNSMPDTVIELGTQAGGSALWFRDRLRALATYGRITRPPRVVSVDVEQHWALAELPRADPAYSVSITLIEGDVRDPSTAERVGEVVGDGRCIVIEDSAHEYDTTLAALTHFARFVPLMGFFVIEDGCVDIDELRLDDSWPRGVLPALHDWLDTSEGKRFRVRRDLELYGVTCHPEGFLQRTA